MEITKTKQIVRRLLERHPILRDDDERLIGNVWANDMAKLGIDPDATTARQFLHHFLAGNITNADSITRARRQLQEKNPELRGKLWQPRQRHQKNVQQELGYK